MDRRGENQCEKQMEMGEKRGNQILLEKSQITHTRMKSKILMNVKKQLLKLSFPKESNEYEK
jgi:hypothetical protein